MFRFSGLCKMRRALVTLPAHLLVNRTLRKVSHTCSRPRYFCISLPANNNLSSEGSIMKTQVLKSMGIILSALWLPVSGYFAFIIFLFAGTGSSGTQVRFLSILGYLVLGLGPIFGFIFTMKRHKEPIGSQGLIFLG